MFYIFFNNYIIIIFFQTKKEKTKKCYVLLERLPKHMIKNPSVKVNMDYEIPCQKTMNFNEIKIEEHDDLDDSIYKDNVSHFLNIFSIIK